MCRTLGSNSGPLACQANTLPIELPRPVRFCVKETFCSVCPINFDIENKICNIFALRRFRKSLIHVWSTSCTDARYSKRDLSHKRVKQMNQLKGNYIINLIYLFLHENNILKAFFNIRLLLLLLHTCAIQLSFGIQFDRLPPH